MAWYEAAGFAVAFTYLALLLIQIDHRLQRIVALLESRLRKQKEEWPERDALLKKLEEL